MKSITSTRSPHDTGRVPRQSEKPVQPRKSPLADVRLRMGRPHCRQSGEGSLLRSRASMRRAVSRSLNPPAEPQGFDLNDRGQRERMQRAKTSAFVKEFRLCDAPFIAAGDVCPPLRSLRPKPQHARPPRYIRAFSPLPAPSMRSIPSPHRGHIPCPRFVFSSLPCFHRFPFLL